jgi:hypothetical protein
MSPAELSPNIHGNHEPVSRAAKISLLEALLLAVCFDISNVTVRTCSLTVNFLQNRYFAVCQPCYLRGFVSGYLSAMPRIDRCTCFPTYSRLERKHQINATSA